MDQKILFIGIIEEEDNRSILNLVKQILLVSDYELAYENISGNIIGLSKNNDVLIIFDLLNKDVEERNFNKIDFDIVVNSFTSEQKLNNIDQILTSSKICILNSDDKDMINIVSKLENVITITYGLNSKATVTISSVNNNSYIEANLCLQRDMVPIIGEKIEPFEFNIETNTNDEKYIYAIMAASTLCLVTGNSIFNKSNRESVKLII